MLMLWLAFLAVIYIGDFPGGMGFLSMCGPFCLIVFTTPQLPVAALYKPAAIGIALGSSLYLFVMPQLSSFTGLGMMIFAATFFICYRYRRPEQGLARAFGLALMVVLMSVSNQQSYSFLSVANTALIFPLLFLLMGIVSYIPYSPYPERAMRRFFARYFRSAQFLMKQNAGDKSNWLAARREAFHRQELASLPAKIGAWSTHPDTALLGATSVKELPRLIHGLEALSYRLQELLEVRRLPQSPVLIEALGPDMNAWRQRVVDTLQHLFDAQPVIDAQDRQRIHDRLKQLEAHIAQALDDTTGNNINRAEQNNLYLYLGAYRGVSETLLYVSQMAGKVDWRSWKEQRFA